jgi:hypothetical protein
VLSEYLSNVGRWLELKLGYNNLSGQYEVRISKKVYGIPKEVYRIPDLIVFSSYHLAESDFVYEFLSHNAHCATTLWVTHTEEGQGEE